MHWNSTGQRVRQTHWSLPTLSVPLQALLKLGMYATHPGELSLIDLPTADGQSVHFNADVIDANVSLLLGLNNLDDHNLLANTRENALVHED